jgi:mono/diheme cytochrome c family protein
MNRNEITVQNRGSRGFIMLAGLVFLLTASCDRDRKTPGWDYFPDMVYSNAYETYSPNANFRDGKTMQAPVEGTVSRDALPFAFGPSVDERTRAGRELVNPLENTAENFARGGEAYGVFCAQCHGENGDGKGHLVRSGVYKYPVRTLVSDEMKKRPDGEIFHTITLGFGVMGAHGFMIRPEDRWKIILYIRNDLQVRADKNKQ